MFNRRRMSWDMICFDLSVSDKGLSASFFRQNFAGSIKRLACHPLPLLILFSPFLAVLSSQSFYQRVLDHMLTFVVSLAHG